jgi:hypothetical protein
VRSCPGSRLAGARPGVRVRVDPQLRREHRDRALRDLLITETIVQEFGSTPRHGIFRFIPNRLRYDDEFDRVYPIELLSVNASPPNTPTDVETKDENGNFSIRIGDPDTEITGRHTYEIVYRVRGAMNGFADHDELFWNAIGDRWEQSIEEMNVRVSGPADITRVACFQGTFGSTTPCDHAQITKKGDAVFSQSNLPAFQAMSVVTALPPGAVESTAPILDERWSLDKAFSRTPLTVGGGIALLVLVVGGLGVTIWRRGRDVRFRGSQVDQVMGGPVDAETQAVPLFERNVDVVEFAPPEDLRPGQVGTLVDEEANTLDVSATIVDLAVRKYLVIEEMPKTWMLGKADWNLRRLPDPEGDHLLPYETKLRDGLFEDGDQVELSELRKKFAERLKKVKDALYDDMVSRKWFLRRPDRVRQTWVVIGSLALSAGIALTIVLATFTKLGLLGIPFALGGLLLLIGRQVDAGEDREGHGDDPPGERLPYRDREGRGAHVEVGRTGERLHALPALRRGLRGHRQVGEGVRVAGAAAERHDLVRQQPAVRLRAIRRQHRLLSP